MLFYDGKNGVAHYSTAQKVFSSRIFVDNEIGRLEILKGIVSVISSDPPCKDDNARFKIVSSET